MSQNTINRERLEDVFTQLLEYPSAQRSEHIHALCGDDLALQSEVKSLLAAADKAKGFLSMGPLATAWPGDKTLESDAMLGQQFDSWQIIRELDSGGMGIVFLADRIDGHYQQQVAIKLARQGLDSAETASRFHSERQILANLRHPNIAQLLDGGTGPDGHPYLVMEYVQGVSIDTWCDSQQLSIEQILNLMITVCDAVQYAHKNLIVHCDLKPSNILVSEGIPKLLDFGIATLLGPSVTSTASAPGLPSGESTPMTPTFAAPEQLRGEPVTTATDIYALGVVLYRLLSQHYPYSVDGSNRSEIADALNNIDIPPPSSKADGKRKTELQGDLDNIVLKALQKDPQQRYSSLQALSTDIQQYLAGYPTSVSPTSWWYQSCKFVKRHSLGVGLTMLAVASLWLGSFISVWQWQVAKDKQILAEQRFTDVREMINTLVVDLPESMATEPGSTKLRAELLDQGIVKLDSLVKTQSNNPELISELAIAYTQLGRLQGHPANVNLGNPVKAAALFEKSIALQHTLLEQQPENLDLTVEIAKNYSAISLIYFAALRKTHLAYEYAEKCRRLFQPWSTSKDPRVNHRLISCYTVEAKWRSDDKEYNAAKKAMLAAEELVQERDGNHRLSDSYAGNLLRARIHEEWAEIEANIGSKEKALDHERQRLDITLKFLQKDPRSTRHFGPARITGDVYHAYAARLAATGKLLEAETAYQQSIQSWNGVIERFPTDASAMRSMVYIYADFAELHRQIAASPDNQKALNDRKKQACDAYKSSLNIVEKMSVDADKIPKRYSWSLRPQEIRQRYEQFC